MKFSLQLEQFHALQMNTIRDIIHWLKVRGELEDAEVRELQFLVDDARPWIELVTEISVFVAQEADKRLRKVFPSSRFQTIWIIA